MKKRIVSAISYVFSAFFFLLSILIPIEGIDLPDRICLSEGEETELFAGLPISAQLSTQNGDVLSINGQQTDRVNALSLNHAISISAQGDTETELRITIGNIFTIKRIRVTGEKERYLYPGGQSIGVAMYTKGALVVATGEFIGENGETHSPGKEAGLLPGDVILNADGKPVKDAEDLSQILNQRTANVSLTFLRNGKQQTALLMPRVDVSDGAYRAGLWVRDSTAGIGTMTFIDPEDNGFGSLGHAITDVDLREILLLGSGSIIPAKVFSVVKGAPGSPGELCGSFIEGETSAGTIRKNTDYGVFGTAARILKNNVYSAPMPIAYQWEIKTGPATLLATVDDQGVKEYQCEIVRVNRQKSRSTKGLVVRVTDQRLLDITGGIVRGMSGSPIIQNGKIVGAVTHVFINDPQQGYGVFIEWMLDELE